MKTYALVTPLLLTLALLAPSIRADDAPAAPAAPAATPAPAAKKAPKTALEKDMDKIGKAVRALRKQIKDPAQNDSSLQLVATIRGAAQDAVNLTPAKAADLSPADRPQFIADYQAGMKHFIAGVDDLSAALQSGDNDKAETQLKQLFALEKKDHKQFRRPEKN